MQGTLLTVSFPFLWLICLRTHAYTHARTHARTNTSRNTHRILEKFRFAMLCMELKGHHHV